MVRDSLTPAPAPDVQPSTPRRALAYAVVLLICTIAGLAWFQSTRVEWPFDSPSYGIAIFTIVALLCGVISRRSNDELVFTNHMTVVLSALLVLHGPVVAAAVGAAVGFISELLQWRTMTRAENLANAALEAIYALVAGIAFLLVWNVSGGSLLLAVTALAVAGTVINNLAMLPWAHLCGSSIRDMFALLREFLPMTVFEAMYIAMGAAAAVIEPILVIGLAVPPILSRHGELHREAAEKARNELMTDSLTGLLSRGTFWSQLEIQLVDQRMGGRVVGLVMCDIDNFKMLNDTYGHVEGDRALIATARALQDVAIAFPRRAWAFRYGGEEMTTIVLDATEDELDEIGELMRVAAADALSPWDTTLSLGVGVCEGDRDAHDFVERIDRALYESKHSGKNTVTRAGSLAAWQESKIEGETTGEVDELDARRQSRDESETDELAA